MGDGMSEIDNACQRLQTLALSCTDVTIKAAPNYPVEDANILPLAIAYPDIGTSHGDDAGSLRMLINLKVDIHFSRVSIVEAYKKINLVIPEYLKRLGGDPTLNGTIDTINGDVSFAVLPMLYNTIPTQAVSFTIPVKVRTGIL
jgi:hypothetical protein